MREEARAKCTGAFRRLERDHRIRWADGGETTPANMQWLCRAHNQWKERQRRV
ncbi:MAG: HNH endonuclease signature motif containing protein [Myxococcota bacterium]